MAKTIIHINVNRIKSNNKKMREVRIPQTKAYLIKPELEPVIKVDDGKEITYVDEVILKGTCKIVHRPFDPLPCGAKVWIEYTSD